MSMARVRLDIHDPLNRTTLKAMLEAAGHAIVEEGAEVALTDDLANAIAMAAITPTIVAVRADDIPRAVATMRKGVYGYISIPLQPGEADLMIRHAEASGFRLQASGHIALRAWYCAPPKDDDAPIPTLDQLEAEHIRAVLRRCKGNHTEAARLLGVGRNTLWRKLKRINASRDGRAS
jgi:DNA-binding NtrC family response regulator